MTLTTTPAFIAIVGADHTIVLPDEIPVGAQVTITVIPAGASDQKEDERRSRFAETLAVIKAASATKSKELSEAELDALVKKARKAPR
ncbi:MAG TPA: hypothetical protein VFX76_06185, partial [Roseiflexaceae bacterium]|nr:hypothetical protein [Roseiflexaceae bacterium]